jgi:hypothetical protein
MDELHDKIASSLGQDFIPSKFINLTFNPPVVLMLQLFETTLSSVGNILQVFGSIPGLKVDPLHLLKKYIPYMDWDEFEKAGDIFVTKMEQTTPQQQ